MKKLLLTSFEPFGDMDVNPTQTIASKLPDEIAGAKLVKLPLPVVFGKARDIVTAAIDREAPDAVLSLGLRGNSPLINVERIGINVADARIPDNSGAQPADQLIAADGPDAYFATIPVRAIFCALKEAGIPAAVSNSAGTYLCNYVMYSVLHHIAGTGSHTIAGFIHVPPQPDQVQPGSDMPSMEVDDMVKAISIALTTIVEHI